MSTIETPPLEKVLKASKVAQHLGCTPDTVYGLIRDGRLRAIRVGRLLRVPESSLADFIAGSDHDAH